MCAVDSLEALAALGLKLENVDGALAALNLKVTLGSYQDLTGFSFIRIIFIKLRIIYLDPLSVKSRGASRP